MPNKEHVELLKSGVKNWNFWRDDNYTVTPDLSGANLEGIDISHAYLLAADLNNADLSRVNLSRANLTFANLGGANLEGARLIRANVNDANLSGARLRGADLDGANMSRAIFQDADLHKANLTFVNLSEALFSNANLRGAYISQSVFTGADLSLAAIGDTIFSRIDLRAIKGLERVRHFGTSIIGVDTLYSSGGQIPEEFLSGCGVPDDFITYLPSIVAASRPIQYHSCFISYNKRDEDFANQLYSRLREARIPVWFAPEHMKAGRKVHEQIYSAIQYHDKLLLILSENSMMSDWVKTEIRRAKKVERQENRRKLFPIRLVSYETIENWECFDIDSGKDLAVDVREYFIPDFSTWTDPDVFEPSFKRLLHDLQAEEG